MSRRIERKIKRIINITIFVLFCVFIVVNAQIILSTSYLITLAVITLMAAVFFIFYKIPFFSEKYIDSQGYVVLKKYNELEHRFIAEKLLNRNLKGKEVVHHINGIKTDNQVNNLCLMDREKHEHFHSWLKWKKEKERKYPSLEFQRITLVNEYEGQLLSNIEPVLTASPKNHEANIKFQSMDLGEGRVGNALSQNKISNFVKLSEKLVYDKELQLKLFEKLKMERKRLSQKKKIPAYFIFKNETLLAISESMPDSEFKMLGIKGVGQKKNEKYGAYFLGVIKKFKEDNEIL